MITESEIKKRFNELLEVEKVINVECVIWLSFCDTDKPKGSQFLGVIVTNALGLSHVIQKTHELGINPNGEIMSYVMDDHEIKPEHFDKFLSADQLIEYGYADKN